MRLLALALLPAAACYAPTVRDCTLACASDHDCAAGQTCTGDHLCASAPSPGCSMDSIDAGEPAAVDARVSPPVDAPPSVSLHIHIAGQGAVVLDGAATCDTMPPQKGDCMLPAPIGELATLVAMPDAGNVFDAWMMACMGQGATCALVPIMPIDISVSFKPQK